MKNNIKKILMLTMIGIIGFSSLLKAQNSYRLANSADMSIKVLGSSNIHDWVMTSTAMESQGEFTFDGATLSAIHAFRFSMAFTSLKSDHTSMDNRTYKSVNAKKYPTISYILTSARVSETEKNKYLVKTKGELTIAGVTQPITMDVTARLNADNTITFTGSDKIKLTDFNINPPSFLLGAMKVANDLTIQFDLVYKTQTSLAK